MKVEVKAESLKTAKNIEHVVFFLIIIKKFKLNYSNTFKWEITLCQLEFSKETITVIFYIETERLPICFESFIKPLI